MKTKLLGLGLGLVMSAAVVVVPSAAFADTTCYTGCSGPTSGVTTPPTSTPAPAQAPIEPVAAPTSGGLPFTGADIEGMAAVGAGALVLGGVMVRRSRRHSRAAA